MIRFANSSNQILSVNYSQKGFLVINFLPSRTNRISEVCYFANEISYNAKLLSLATDNIIQNEVETKEWLKNLTLKFTGASGNIMLITFTDNNIIVRSVSKNNSSEIFSFATDFTVPNLIAFSDYLSSWKFASIISDMFRNHNRNSNPQQYNNPQYNNQNYNPQQYNNRNYNPQGYNNQQYNQNPQPQNNQYNSYPQQNPVQPIQPIPNNNPQVPNNNPQVPNNNQGQIPSGFPTPDEI